MPLDDVAQVRDRLQRFQLSNADLSQQLSDILRRSQKLASSLGFRDIYEAQAAIDTSDSDLSYRQCFEELQSLRAAQVTHSTRVRRIQPRPTNGSDSLHIRDLVPDEISVDVLPYALRLAYCELSGLRQCDADQLPTEGSIRMHELSDPALEILQKNAKLVKEWEDIFSFRAKDRKSRISRLTPRESFRFQRALYRIALVSWLYGMGSIPESDEQDVYYSDIDTYRDQQSKFLVQYSTDELFEIRRLTFTMCFVAESAMVKDRGFLSMRDVYDWRGLFLFGGPSFIIHAYANREVGLDGDIRCGELMGYLDDVGPASGFLTGAVEHILQTRGEFDSNPQQRILDYVEGSDDLCTRCKSQSDIRRGVCLRNESTWDDLIFDVLFCDSDGFLAASAGIKYPETKFFANEIKKSTSQQLMKVLYGLRPDRYTSWKSEDWTCLDCWTSLIYDTIPIWWAERRPQQF